MMLNSEECTLVATAYAHKIVKERKERVDKEFKNLIRQIVERRVSKEILSFAKQHTNNLAPVKSLHFISSEFKVIEVPNPSICIPSLKTISVSDDEFEAIRSAMIDIYNIENLKINLIERIKEFLQQAKDLETILEIMPEIMPTIKETITTKDNDGNDILNRKKHAIQAYYEFKKYVEIKFALL